MAYRYLADFHWRTQQQEQATHVAHALAQAVPDAYFLDRLGASYEESGLLRLAQAFYQEAARVEPHLPSARYNLEGVFLRQGQLEKGISEVQEALRLYPEFAEAHQTLGLAFSEQGAFQRTIDHLQRALELQPALSEARNHMGRLYMAQGHLDDVIHTFQTLVRYHPEVAAARHNLAVAYARQRRRSEALEQFRAAIRLQSEFHAAQIDLATLLIEMRQPEEAIDILQAAMAAMPKSGGTGQRSDAVEVRFHLAVAYLIANRLAEAVTAFAVILQERPAHANTHLYLGRIFFQQGEFARAWYQARQAAFFGAPADDLLTALRRVAPPPQ